MTAKISGRHNPSGHIQDSKMQLLQARVSRQGKTMLVELLLTSREVVQEP